MRRQRAQHALGFRLARHALGCAAALLAFALLASASVEARGLSAAEASALAPRANGYAKALASRSGQGIVALMPPKVLAQMAERQGKAQAAVRSALASEVSRELRRFEIKGVTVDVAAADRRSLSDGTTIALVPTRTKVAVPLVGVVEELSRTLALRDGGQWYLIRVEDADQRRMVSRAYPGFQGVSIPGATFRMLGRGQ